MSNLAFGPGFHRKTVNGRVQICIQLHTQFYTEPPFCQQPRSVGH